MYLVNGTECEVSAARPVGTALVVVKSNPEESLAALLGRLSRSVTSEHSVGVAESALLMALAKAAYEQLYPETKAGQAQARGLHKALGHLVEDKVSLTFKKRVEADTGIGEKTAERLCRWGARIAPDVLVALKGHQKFDKGAYLAKLANVGNHDAQRAMVHQWLNPNDRLPPRAMPRYSPGPDDIYTDQRLYIASLNVDLHLGNSLEILPTLGGKYDAVISDPPYGIAYEGKHGTVHGDASFEEASEGIPHFVAALKDEAFVALFTRWDVECKWVARLGENGVSWRAQKILTKDTSTMVGGSNAVQRNQHENIIIASKGMPQAYPWLDEKGITGKPGSVVKLDSSVFHCTVDRDIEHSTPKSENVCERLVRSYCPEGGAVLDPYMGSGPMAVAAIRAGRGYLGIELEQRHFALAVERVLNELKLGAFAAPEQELLAA